MKAPHPDSIASWKERDSLAGLYGDDSATRSKILPQYNGHVEGHLYLKYSNEDNPENTVNPIVPLAGTVVRLRERDEHFDDVFAETVTNDEGFFKFKYDKGQYAEYGDVELYLEFESRNPVYDIDVKMQHAVVNRPRYKVTYDLGTHGKENVLIDGLNITIQDPIHEPFQALHYAKNAYKFIREAGYNTSQVPNGLNMIIYLDTDKDPDRTEGSSKYNFGEIYLGDGDEAREDVVYHEFGHHVMWKLQGDYSIFAISFSHPWEEEQATLIAWTEGWGYGFSAMVDQYYRNEDGGEWEWCNSVPGSGNDFKQEMIEWRNREKFKGSNGFKAEYNIACALYDLYDGPDKFGESNPDETARRKYNDKPGEVDVLGPGYKEGFDEVSLTFY